MLLVAQHVIAPDGRQGVNAYFYSHGRTEWLDPPRDNELQHGPRLNQIVGVSGVGNRVRSYLDVLAPDSTANSRLVEEVLGAADFMASMRKQLPWRMAVAEIGFTFNCERALAPRWRDELHKLVQYAIDVRLNAPPEGDGVLGGRLGIFRRR